MSLIFKVDSLSDVQRPFEGTIDVDEVKDALPFQIELGGREVAVAGTIQRLGRSVHVAGRVTTTLDASCSRCLCALSLEVDTSFARIFSADDAHRINLGEGAEVDITSFDLDIVPFEGDSVDVTPVALEQLLLALPSYPLCSEDCKGLCPHCGGDKNVDPCSCEPPVDPRWAALQGLKDTVR